MSFKATYQKSVVPALQQAFGYKNPNAVPTVKSIVINAGVGLGLKEAKFLETAESTLRRITGQRPVKMLARKSISAFKIRQGNVVGLKVTLRGPRMWNFLEKLIKITFPRVRDFRGLTIKSFDGRGNYSIGFSEHIAFPEIRNDEIETVHGLQVTITTSAKSDAEARALLSHLGFPFKEDK